MYKFNNYLNFNSYIKIYLILIKKNQHENQTLRSELIKKKVNRQYRLEHIILQKKKEALEYDNCKELIKIR